MEYVIARGSAGAFPTLDWDDPGWGSAVEDQITEFAAKSTYRPETHFKTCWNDDGIRGLFRVVNDTCVRSVAEKDMDEVWLDSCVEFFVWPGEANGYFNFEFNCGGLMLSTFIRNWTRLGKGFVDYDPMKPEELAMVKRAATMPRRTPEEIHEPTEWRLGWFIPFALLCGRPGIPLPKSGDVWRANFYKCGNGTTHPHWGMWRPVDPIDFHQPKFFGPIRFE